MELNGFIKQIKQMFVSQDSSRNYFLMGLAIVVFTTLRKKFKKTKVYSNWPILFESYLKRKDKLYAQK